MKTTTETLKAKYESYTDLMKEVEIYDLNNYDSVMIALYDEEIEPFHKAIMQGEKRNT